MPKLERILTVALRFEADRILDIRSLCLDGITEGDGAYRLTEYYDGHATTRFTVDMERSEEDAEDH